MNVDSTPAGPPLMDSNPFATRFIRPGAIPYLFPDAMNASHLIDRLRRTAWFGQIVGPHGSGKSTLLETLVPRVERGGRRVVRFTLRRHRRPRPVENPQAARWGVGTLVVVDGFEQLGPVRRMWLKCLCRRRRCGLLVTSHRRIGLPTLIRTDVEPAVAARVVALLQRNRPALVGPNDVADHFGKHPGNLRETLFDLYDLAAARQRDGAIPA